MLCPALHRPVQHRPTLRLLPLLVTTALATSLAAPLAAQAQPLAVTNAGFEAQATPPGAFLVGVPTGWQAYDPGGILDGNLNALGRIRPLPGTAYFPAGTPEGDQAALVFLSGANAAPAGLQQTLAATLQASTRYSLQVDVGNIDSGTSLPGSADGGGQFYNLAGFPGYRLELLAGGQLLAADHNGLGDLIAEGSWRTATLLFDSDSSPALLGQALGIRLINLAQPGSAEVPNIEVDFDNVRLVASPVPEPAQGALWLAALLWGAMAWQRRIRRRPGRG